jgi:hypothetical protein
LAAVRRRKKTPDVTVPADPTVQLLEFIAGLVVLEDDAQESDKLRVAKKVGLKAAQVARIFGKSTGAAQKALERTK